MQRFENALLEDTEINLELINYEKQKLIGDAEYLHEQVKYTKECKKDFENAKLGQMKLVQMRLVPENKFTIDHLENIIERYGKDLQMYEHKLNEMLEEQKELARLETQMKEQIATIQQQIDEARPNIPQQDIETDDEMDYDDYSDDDDDYDDSDDDDQQQGLSPASIQQFHQFEAGQSQVGERCSVCQDDIVVGRRLMRLDCDGQHVFHQDCVEGWFADHNTCPNCRHVFQ